MQMILTVGRIVGCEPQALALITQYQQELEAIKTSAQRFPHRPRVYFEEWGIEGGPLISGIRWVEELLEVAGGICIFPELRQHQSAKDRIIQPEEVIARDPEIIIASWCGRPVKKAVIRNRPGWSQISAIRHNHLYEVKSTYILQPGPAALTEGVVIVMEIFDRWEQEHS